MSDIIRKIKYDYNKIGNVQGNKTLDIANQFHSIYPNIIFITTETDTKTGVFYKYKSGVYKKISTIELEHLLLHHPDLEVVRGLSNSVRRQIIDNIKTLRYSYYSAEEFNQNNIINFKNGIFNLDTGEFLPHSPEILTTIQLPYEYDILADCRLWEQTLADILPEEDAVKLAIQEFFGYCFSRDTDLERSLFLIGKAQTGKSTILEVLMSLLGEENISSLPIDYLKNPKYIGGIINKYINICTELPKNASDYEDAFKKISSGEPVTVDTKYEPTYTTRTFCKLVYSANKMPHINDTSDAVYRRMILIFLNNVIPNDVKDYKRKKNLRNECSGIFNWSYRGYKRLMKQEEFTVSKTVAKNIRYMRVQNNSVLYYCTESLEIHPNKEECYISKKHLYRDYCEFTKEVGIKGVLGMRNFNEEVSNVFHDDVLTDQRKYVDGGQQRVWGGLKFKAKCDVGETIQWED